MTHQGKISKEARECVQECVSEFISFITSEASDKCQAEPRKTINGQAILQAMGNLGFEPYYEPLGIYLQKFREANKGEKPAGEEYMQDEGMPGNDFIINAIVHGLIWSLFIALQAAGTVATTAGGQQVFVTYEAADGAAASGSGTQQQQQAPGTIDSAGNFRPM